ncbi:MAG: hypothetical protein AAF366_18770, partial [Pseudomonadota bacterium]
GPAGGGPPVDLPPPPPRGPGGVVWLRGGGGAHAGARAPAPPPARGIATTDQSDAFAALRLSGPDADAVLARLTPLNLAEIAPGQTARSLLGHMNTLFHRTEAEAWDLLLFRSMAAHAIHEIDRAMRGVAARAALDHGT